MIMEPLMATAAEATDMVRLGRSAVYQLITARQRESIKIGRSQRASVASIPHVAAQSAAFGGAAPHVVMSAFLGLPGLHRQRVLRRSKAWIWDFSSMLSTIAFSGGLRYNPTTSLTLATSSGSVENLNVSARQGCTR